MMQSILFLRPKDEEPIDRLINIDHLATAWRNEDGSTSLIIEGANITMGMKFEEFLDRVQKLIADNHRISTENAAAWHNKRVKDSEETMRLVMKEIMTHDH